MVLSAEFIYAIFIVQLHVLRAISNPDFVSMIDDATRTEFRTIERLYDGRELTLVMSDEFNTDGRSFSKGSDPLFEAIEKPDDTNEAIQFYNSSTDYVTTEDGMLTITTRAVKTSYLQWDHNHLRPERLTKNYTSGMVQTWNKFCFTGGVLEISLELPGHADSGGLWPAMWLMGNLARATFEKTTLDVWPWSYSTCGEIEQLDFKQEINACNDSPGYGMQPHQGRGAPEVDIFEVMPGHEMPTKGPVLPFMSSSLQLSPGVDKSKFQRPINGKPLNSSFTWYEGIKMSSKSSFNDGFWGQECGPVIDNSVGRVHKYMEDAISVNTDLNDTHFEQQNLYRLEWQPGKRGGVGFLRWYLNGELLLGIESSSIEQLTGALIPFEPLYLVMNTAISHRWGMPEPCPIKDCAACWHCYDCTNPDCQCALPKGMKSCKNLPAKMKIDYVRLYQDPQDPAHTLGCSPTEYPTAEFIKSHSDRYADWQPMAEDSEKWYWRIRHTSMVVLIILAMLFVLWLIWYCKKTYYRYRSSNGYAPIPDAIPAGTMEEGRSDSGAAERGNSMIEMR